MTARLRRRLAPRGEDGFALVLSLLLMLVVAALALTMGAVVLQQAKPTQEARKQVATVNAAGAGLQVSLATLRSANDGNGRGSILKLPCTSSTGAQLDQGPGTGLSVPGATLTGAVTAGTGAPGYSVSVAYYVSDPTGKPLSWLSDPSNVLPCPLATVPYFAYLLSHGTGAAVPGNAATQGNRSQVAVYQFATSNLNVEGGRLKEYGTTLCVDAGPEPWAAGRTLTLQTCLALHTPQQTWQYRKDLSLFFGGDTSLNLCIEASAAAPTPTLQLCTGSGTGTTYPYAPGQQAQEWGFNDNGHFSAALDDGTVTNSTGGRCLQPAGATDSTPAGVGAALAWVTCQSGTTGYSAFNPDAEVGAGKAGGNETGVPGPPTFQYVNYAQFGRCLDITGTNVNADHLIAYPCKQAPNSAVLTFNQVWTYTPVGTGYGTLSVVHPNGTPYCLQAPSAGVWLVVKPCTTALVTQQWRPTGTVTGNYADSYRLVSQSAGTCMTVAPAGSGDPSNSWIALATCSDSLKQKWNAPAVQPSTGLNDVSETVGG